MFFPVPIIHLVSSLRAQVRWRKHCASIATAGSLGFWTHNHANQCLLHKTFQQPQSQGPSRCHQISLSTQVLQLGSFVFFHTYALWWLFRLSTIVSKNMLPQPMPSSYSAMLLKNADIQRRSQAMLVSGNRQQFIFVLLSTRRRAQYRNLHETLCSALASHPDTQKLWAFCSCSCASRETVWSNPPTRRQHNPPTLYG